MKRARLPARCRGLSQGPEGQDAAQSACQSAPPAVVSMQSQLCGKWQYQQAAHLQPRQPANLWDENATGRVLHLILERLDSESEPPWPCQPEWGSSPSGTLRHSRRCPHRAWLGF